jgi:hypothetical protein
MHHTARKTALVMLLPIFFGIRLPGGQAAGKPAFSSSEIEGRGSTIMYCDLDGDGLKDIVLADGLDLKIFYQDPVRGFTRKPQQQFRLDDRPCAVWPARLGKKAESLLVMTSDGVTELCFTSRTAPPEHRQIIKQTTIIPETLEEPDITYFPLSAETGNGWPLMLVPTVGGLQVWKYNGDWTQTQTLENGLDIRNLPSVSNPGYTQTAVLDLCISDVHHDGRDDLIIRRDDLSGRETYAVYLQETNGRFGPTPAATAEGKPDRHSWLCWLDINRDGKLDLVKSTWLREPWFVPGVSSGKVLVEIHLADAQGKIRAQPQQVFRKNDWTPALPMVDVDGDGYPDLVLGYSLFDSREGMRKMLTAKQLDFSLKLHFYRPGEGFPAKPDCEREVVIHLDRHSVFMGADRRQFFNRFVDVSGDFNGDGKRDLLVRDRSEEISAYCFISREKGFSRNADFRFKCPEPIEHWEIRDLNGDGVSDLVVKLRDHGFRIFLSHVK